MTENVFEFEEKATPKRDPFLTGSRAYGSPRPESDVDVVCLMNYVEANILNKVLKVHWCNADTRAIVKTGCLNLIICTLTEDYDAWLGVTNTLIAMRPVTREVAILHFNNAKLTGEEYNR